MTTLALHWNALATSALLGTDRHPVPDPPPGALEDLLVERPPLDRAEAVLDEAAALAAMRRGGMSPNPPAARLVPCAPDPRPPCPPAAVARLHQVLLQWPHLVDEWLARAVAGGWMLPGDAAVLLLARFRGDPQRRAVVAALTGDLSDWLAELFPDQLAPACAPSKAAATPAAPADLPADLTALGLASPQDCAAALAAGLAHGRFTNRHRPLLVQLVSSLPVGHLEPVADALERAGTNADTLGLALTLADLTRTRLELIRELMP